MKLNQLQKILLGFIGICLTLSIGMGMIGGNSPLTTISREGYDIFSMLKYSIIDYPIRTITENFSIFGRMWALEEENEILRQQVEGVASMQARIEEQKQEIQSLKEMNELRSIISDYQTIPATVMVRAEETWNNTITIDAGSEDGVEENYAVITPLGLIGRVQSVSKHSSVVKLLTVTDGTNKVSVKIIISDGVMADAILESYNYEEKSFMLKLLDSNNTVTENMSVITSGMGGVFPSGLLVGTITRVEELSNAIGMNVFITPAADFGSLDYVYVVKRLGSQDE